jgi:hypothetical protein
MDKDELSIPIAKFHQLTTPLLCHPDRSEAQWRDLQFLFPVHADTNALTILAH